MNICFASYEGIVLSMGGPYVKIHSLKNHLEILGHKVDLFNMWEDSHRLKEFDIVNIFGANLAVFGFARNLRHRGINYVVNPIFFSSHNAGYLRTACKINDILQKFAPGIWMDYSITKDICNWAGMVLPNTKDEGDLIRDGFSIPSDKIEVIHNGVSGRFLDGDASVFKKKYEVENFILTVGHIGPKRKNMLAYVKALAKIDHPVVIIGSILGTGETNEVLDEVKRNKNILLVDALENDSPMLASAYAACDTFVLPSQFETPGRAALEAALAGAKIVITPYGGTKEYFRDMASYIDPYSVQSIKEGIEDTLNKPKTENLKEFIKNNFLWDKIALHCANLYSRVNNELS